MKYIPKANGAVFQLHRTRYRGAKSYRVHLGGFRAGSLDLHREMAISFVAPQALYPKLPKIPQDEILASRVVPTTITMLSSARLRAVVDTQSFLNSKFVMPLAHLKIEKYRLERARPADRSDLVLTEWTYTRKSTHKMKNRSWVWWFLEVSTAFIFGLRRPHALRGWFQQ